MANCRRLGHRERAAEWHGELEYHEVRALPRAEDLVAKDGSGFAAPPVRDVAPAAASARAVRMRAAGPPCPSPTGGAPASRGRTANTGRIRMIGGSPRTRSSAPPSVIPGSVETPKGAADNVCCSQRRSLAARRTPNRRHSDALGFDDAVVDVITRGGHQQSAVLALAPGGVRHADVRLRPDPVESTPKLSSNSIRVAERFSRDHRLPRSASRMALAASSTFTAAPATSPRARLR
jgi:hypothetical protein